MIPRNITELTVEFFSSILGCPVASFAPEESLPMQGNTSVLVSVQVNFAAPLTFPPRRLFLKFALPLEDSDARNISFTRQLFIDAQVYRKEIAFYQYAMKHKEMLEMLPPVYYAEIEGPFDHFLLVMGEGGLPQNQLIGCSLDTSRLIIAQLAHFHGRFVNSHLNRPNGLEPCYSPSHQLLNQIIKADKSPEELLDHCMEHFESKFNDFSIVANSMATKSGDSLENHLTQVKSRFTDKSIMSDLRLAFTHNFFAPEFRTLIHGDFRLDNILFDPQSNAVKFIDFQAIHYGHPAYDLAQFLVQCHDNLPDIFDELITIYYNTLCESTKSTPFSLEELMLAVRSTVVLQILLLSFHLAPLAALIDPQTGRLPESMDRFMDLIALINKRALSAYLAL